VLSTWYCWQLALLEFPRELELEIFLAILAPSLLACRRRGGEGIG